MIIYGKDHRFNAQCTVTNFCRIQLRQIIRVNIRFSNELFKRNLSDLFLLQTENRTSRDIFMGVTFLLAHTCRFSSELL